MEKFNKTKTEADGYYPIYANNQFTMVNKEAAVVNMKALHGFCACNSLPSGRIAKLQGGYYVLNDDECWEFLAGALGYLTFEVLFKRLKKLKFRANMSDVIKETEISIETCSLIPNNVLESKILDFGGYISQTVLAKWLREVHNIYVTSLPSYGDDTNDKKHYFEISYGKKIFQMGDKYGYYTTYEEAFEIGLKEALKKVVDTK